MASALEAKRCSLNYLHMARCQIGSDGGAALVEALKKNASLTALSVVENSLGAEGSAMSCLCFKPSGARVVAQRALS